MAAIWDVKIIVINEKRKEISVSATRIQNTVIHGPYTILSALIETTEQNLAIIDQIWSMYQSDLAKQNRIAAIVKDFELRAKTTLEAKETL